MRICGQEVEQAKVNASLRRGEWQMLFKLSAIDRSIEAITIIHHGKDAEQYLAAIQHSKLDEGQHRRPLSSPSRL